MGGIKLRIHPLFYLFGLYYALTGRIFIFIIYTVCALSHELGHSFAAANAGYKLNRITLMPFGAVVSGDLDGLKCADELKIALAGPFLNLAIGLFFVSLWWLSPEIYAYTDIAAQANFTLALINFIPVYPLDGGRVAYAFLSLRLKRETAGKICRIAGVIFAVALFALFIISLFFTFNLSFLFFSLFVLFGALDKNKENRYIRLYSSLTDEKLKKGVNYKKTGIDKSVNVKKMLSLLDPDAINEVVVYDRGEPVAVLSQQKINNIIEKGDLYSPIEKYISVT